MRTNHFLALAAATALLLGTTIPSAQTQEPPAAQPQAEATPERAPGMMGPGMMGMTPEMMRMMHRMMRMQEDDAERPGLGMMPGMMGPGMMGMMGQRMMRHRMAHERMMRMIFILMDTDGDGALSLDEVQAVTERTFNAIDADGDGRVTLEELQAFFRGTERPAQQMQMPMQDDMPMQERMPMRQGMMPEGMPMQHDMAMEGAPATQAYMEAMQAMQEEMAAMEMTGDPGIDFAIMMIPHHQSAIDMAEAYLEHGDDLELIQLANEIIAEQRREIAFLENWLREQDQ